MSASMVTNIVRTMAFVVLSSSEPFCHTMLIPRMHCSTISTKLAYAITAVSDSSS